jgi:nicotinate-nucleotide adenylyltransferase
MPIQHALLGGTFDPIHVGHLDVAEAARHALLLDHVVLLPSNMPPHRGVPAASAPHRFAMAALAIQDRPGVRVSDLELLADQPSFTDTTLDRLEARGFETARLAFVIGADAFREIRSWKNFPGILDRCHFVVVSRPGTPAPAMRQALPEVADRMVDAPGAPGGPDPAVLLVDATTAAVSSTDVRDRVAAGRSIAGLVPPAVAAHIERHGLYAARRQDPGQPAAAEAAGSGARPPRM